MKIPDCIWMIILIFNFSYYFPSSSENISQRNLVQLKNMINYKGYHVLEYMNYGCW